MCAGGSGRRLARMSRRAPTLLAVLLAGALPATASAGPPSFAQLSGEAGCLSVAGIEQFVDEPLAGCRSAPGLLGPRRLVVSPNGRQVYVVGGGHATSAMNGVTVLARDAGSGELAFASCVSDDGGDGRVGSDGTCTDANALARASGLAIAPGGRFAYVSASGAGAVSWFARDPTTGELTQAGCIKATPFPGEACTQARALFGASDVLVSRDGETVYVAAASSGAIAVFDRDAGTGALTERSCVSATGSDGACGHAPGLAGVNRLVLGPGDDDLYASSTDSGSIVTLAVDPDSGDLTALDCLVGHAPDRGPCHSAHLLDQGVYDMAVSPDGRGLVATAGGADIGEDDVSGPVLLTFQRDAQGRLSQDQGLQYGQPQGDDAVDPEYGEEPPLVDGCGRMKAVGYAFYASGAIHVAISADGRGVFAAAGGDLGAFTRDPGSGELTQFGCAESELLYRSCSSEREIGSAVALAASPDARNLYVASDDGYIAVFGASVAISAQATAVRSGRLGVRLACPAARSEGCRGRLSAGSRGRAFRVRAGRSARFVLRLTTRARRTLRRHGHARVTIVAHDAGAPFASVTRRLTVRR
jgi:6-phosphogluconolactonase (cycloisomerase 2 family)